LIFALDLFGNEALFLPTDIWISHSQRRSMGLSKMKTRHLLCLSRACLTLCLWIFLGQI